jgi:flavin reductase (DIM6/NTAB) family NADH-FMN oxidoreductase RutF
MNAPLVNLASDPAALRSTFARYPSGLAALAATVDGEDHVLVASSFTVGVSLEPALVMFAIQKSSTTWPLLSRADRIGVSVLADAHGDLCRRLAAKDRSARLAGVAVHRGQGGALFIGQVGLELECTIFDVHPAGDHDIIVLEVLAHRSDPAIEPLVFHGSRFRSLVVEGVGA